MLHLCDKYQAQDIRSDLRQQNKDNIISLLVLPQHYSMGFSRIIKKQWIEDNFIV